MSQREQTNYYEILEVTPDAAASEIHKAYQRARQTYSQDNPALYSMFSPDEARELLRLIDEAYNVLSNQSSRKSYDDSLVGRSGGAPGTSAAPISVAPAFGSSATATAAAAAPGAPVSASRADTRATTTELGRSSSTPPPITAQSSSFDPDSSEEFVVRRRELQRAAMPPGQGRTSLSTYKLDDTFENEISSATEFDGGLIQRVRLYKNISIDKMSDATRISRPYLMAVETNDYKSLPAAVFVRGFIVQIARQLGLDENKVASSYMRLFKAGGGK